MKIQQKKYVMVNDKTEEFLNKLLQLGDNETIKYLIDNGALEVSDYYVEQLSIEDRVTKLEQDVAMLKATSSRQVYYTYGIRGSYDKTDKHNSQEQI